MITWRLRFWPRRCVVTVNYQGKWSVFSLLRSSLRSMYYNTIIFLILPVLLKIFSYIFVHITFKTEFTETLLATVSCDIPAAYSTPFSVWWGRCQKCGRNHACWSQTRMIFSAIDSRLDHTLSFALAAKLFAACLEGKRKLNCPHIPQDLHPSVLLLLHLVWLTTTILYYCCCWKTSGGRFKRNKPWTLMSATNLLLGNNSS